MQLPFINRLLHYDPAQVDQYFRQDSGADARYARRQNNHNLRTSVIFMYLLAVTQIIVGIGRYARGPDFPFYNLFIIGFCLVLIAMYRRGWFRHHATRIWVALFFIWSCTFPFFIIRTGGYDAPTYPVYHLVVLYVILFFDFRLRQYAILLASVFISSAVIALLQPTLDMADFLEKHVLLLLFIIMAMTGAYIGGHLRRKEFVTQEILEIKNEQLEAAYRRLSEQEIELVRTEKMASVGRLAAGLAHEINNPLNFITGNLSLLRSDLKEVTTRDDVKSCNKTGYADVLDELDEAIQACERGAARIKDVIANLRLFSRLDEADRKAVDIHECIRSAVSVLQSKLAGIGIEEFFGKVDPILCRPAQLTQLFHALIENAIDAVPRTNGLIRIETAQQDTRIVCRILDNGPGVGSEIQSKIFDPFFTTKDVGKGAGIGLSLVYSISREHGGNVRLDSPVEGMTCFTVELPLHPAENKSS